jgi:formate dehydrogenase subunit gamma
MMRLPTLARFGFGLLAVCGVLAFAAPAQPQPQSRPTFIDPDASAVTQQKLLQQAPRIEGDILIPDSRERVLIQPAGRVWDHFHEVTLHWFGAIVILGTLTGLAAVYFILGRLRMRGGRSGRKVPRFNPFERFVHWLTAVSFIVLGLTGLNITFGKLLLRPLIGSYAFGTFSGMAKYVHNFTSFPFVLGILLIAVIWLKDNIPEKIDLDWLRQGGGFIASKHPHARRFNAGEKLVFWGVLGAGALVALSGYLLLFPFYVTNIAGMQLAQVVHSIIAILFVALILGHIYIGTLGTEGAFEAMGTGEVDLNWAKEHHDLWLQEQLAKGRIAGPPETPPAVPAE